jgi:beta-glucosidase
MIKFIILVFLIIDLAFSAEKPKAWEPEERLDRAKNLFEAHLEETKKLGKEIEIVFTGDSGIEHWGSSGKEVWKEYYAPLHAVNYGVGGDRTQNLIWRIRHGELDGLNPKLVVLLIGANNLREDSGDDIAKGIKQVIEDLHAKLPHTKILLMGIAPVPKYPEATIRINYVNSIIKTYANGHTIQFLDLGPQITEDGDFHKLYINDMMHLSEVGYELWAKVMDPLFKKMLQ